MPADPHQVTRDFEAALCRYTGARFAVTTTSCTMAITLALSFWRSQWTNVIPVKHIDMPWHSYVGVPAAILNAGFTPRFFPIEWEGEYQLEPLPVWDSARRFTFGMFRRNQMQCVSFHSSKILGDTQGGAILHDNDLADAWLRRARFDGRTEGVSAADDDVQYPSWHAYMSPDVAARLLWKLSNLPLHNADLPKSDYPDLSTLSAFK